MEKTLIDEIISYSTERLKNEYLEFVKQMKDSNKSRSVWIIDPAVFGEAKCPETGEQRMILIALMIIGMCKDEWMCDRLRKSCENHLHRFTALISEINDRLEKMLKGDGTTLVDLAADIVNFNACNIDPYGMNRQQLYGPRVYLPYPQNKKTKMSLLLEEDTTMS